MVERIQDLNLPNAVVARLIKDAIPDGINVSKEFRVALARAASVYVIYLASASTAEAKKKNLKMITANHVFDALEEIEFENFIPTLKESLETFRKSIKEKKENKAAADSNKKKDSSSSSSSSTTTATSSAGSGGSGGGTKDNSAIDDDDDDDDDVECIDDDDDEE